MAIHGFPGGVISATAPTTSPSGASGVWTLDDQLQAGANWPVTPALATNSVRTRASASAYMARTPTVAGNRRTLTISAWVKRGIISSGDREIISAGSGSSLFCGLRFISTDKFDVCIDDSNYRLRTTQVFRDPSAWYHIVVAIDTTQSTASNRIKLYVNGVQVTAFDTALYPIQNYNTQFNAATIHNIARRSEDDTAYFDGYITELNLIDGQALTPNYFGATNPSTGAWQPATYRGTYGTNGFYLPFTNNTQYFSGLFDGTTETAYVGYNNVLNLETSAYTVEAFVNPTSLANVNGENQVIGRWYSGSSRRSYLLSITDTGIVRWNVSTNGLTGSGNSTSVASSAGAVTTNTWTHIRISQTGGTVYLGINGTIVTTATDAIFNNVYTSTDAVSLGSAFQGDATTVFTGRISNVRIVKGTALSTTTYTVPTAPLTAISGTSLLTLQSSTLIDNSGNSLTITNPSGNPTISTVAPTQFGVVGLGTDFSGNNNTWTTNNISLTAGSTYDSMTDVPTLTSATAANFCTLNPLIPVSTTTAINGNLGMSSYNPSGSMFGTVGVSSGKWYFEMIAQADAMSGISGTPNGGAFPGAAANAYTWDSNNATKYSNGSGASYGSATSNGDIVGVAFDLDTGSITFYKNNVSQGVAYTFSPSGSYFPAFRNGSAANTSVNFGQRPFAYTPPTGFVALNTFNLPTPTIGATASTQANKYFDVSLYTGTDASLTITNSGSMQPDWVWVKARSQTDQNVLCDSVRGATKRLYSNLTNAEDSTGGLVSINSNGFTLGNASTSQSMNNSGVSYVAWQWNANGAGSSNTAGSITSTVSANTSAGFSVVTYTGTGSAATVGHGLGVAPKMVIVKRRNTAESWAVYTTMTSDGYLFLNSTAAKGTAFAFTVFGNGTVVVPPSSTVFSVATDGLVNGASNTYVAYCFSEIAGYSKFGSFTGNNSSDGNFIYLGFRPRWIMCKQTSGGGGNWFILDTARNTSNVMNNILDANLSDAERNANIWDATANGMKLRIALSGDFIFAAFAETPFNYANAR